MSDIALEDEERNPDGTYKAGNLTAITPLNAKALQVKSVQSRLAKKTQRNREALLQEAKAACPPDYTVETWEDAFGLFTGSLVEDGLDKDRALRARVAVYKAVGKAVDAFPDKARLTVEGEGGKLVGPVDEMLALLMEARKAKEDE